MRETFKDELEVFYRQSGVFIQMLMYDAEKQSSSIRADVNFMENYKALQQVKDFEELIMESDFTLVKKPTMKAQLPGLGAPVQIERVVVQDEETQAQNVNLKRQVTELQSRINDSGSAASVTEENERLKAQLAETQSQLDMKVNQTPAVQNMKKMLQDKNTVISELREKLAQLEAGQ